ncbi:MAG: protein phosphatase 2C domain-containing protein [Leptolyngbya sp. UWPOB_LEPTO1]|uniref:PP2C family serine/threonine-protein phosphatase n=1 Tax=Leptolyngbya sp. UWPOB_LEPTO1 TaxID=2815653 RepID=UPI001AC5B5A7|nr:PP2C family serine/threonine-protein phosphatase [Leptolyngbya sp. UWPOB_LEPTO1]MBN8564823.1 protein phosphatase 2C domain-containing protein [Leptolyngbya sp. UWPOB_LEPTO1]
MNNLYWCCDGKSIQGAAHQRTGLVNQDAIHCETIEFEQQRMLLTAISDGHGGQSYFRSHVGADYAVRVSTSLLKQTISAWGHDPIKLCQRVQDLPQQIVGQWRRSVIEHSQQYPFTSAEWSKLQTQELLQQEISRSQLEDDPSIAYGATLLLIFITEAFALYFQVGDGDILCVQPDGTTEHPLPIDARLIANRTISLCTPQAWEEGRLRVCSVQEVPLPAMILASTDGYANSYATDEDFFRIGIDYLQSVRTEGFDRVIANLPMILRETSYRGSGDDITLGMMYLENGSTVRSATSLHSPIIQHPTTRQSLLRIVSPSLGIHHAKERLSWIWIPPLLLLIIGASLLAFKRLSSQLPASLIYPIHPSIPQSSIRQNPIPQRPNQLLPRPVSTPSNPKKNL